MTTITFTPDLLAHLRVVLFEALYRQAESLAEDADAAREAAAADEGGIAGDDAECTWRVGGMREAAALLDLIGWSKRDEADGLSAVRDA